MKKAKLSQGISNAYISLVAGTIVHSENDAEIERMIANGMATPADPNAESVSMVPPKSLTETVEPSVEIDPVVEDQIKKLTLELAEANTKIESLSGDLNKSAEDLSESEKALTEVNAKLGTVEAQNADLLEQVAGIEELQSKLDDSEKALANANAEIADLKKKAKAK